uniref:Translational activator of cytochrome c oxidase 1 n=1 Tax=Salvator merianae TaxID=96440 RepID=A0A8D0B3N9_SALMN
MSAAFSLTRLNVLFRRQLLALLDHSNCPIHGSCATLAGHNKWSKVKNVKIPKDHERALLFQKLSMMIRVAVKEGGPNPQLNSNLAGIIEQCRSKNMPKSSIEAAIAGGEKAKSSYLLFEVRGPGGCSLLIETLTDNVNRTSHEIHHLLNRYGGLISRGARHCFEKKGIITVSSKDQSGSPVYLERALELAIEAGAEDVQEQEDDEKMVLKFICAVPMLHKVRKNLESQGLCPFSSGLEYIPTVNVQLSDEEMVQASQLLNALQDSLDVVQVYDNVA